MNEDNAYWSGYFTTNSKFKKEVVTYSNLVHSYQLMTALSTDSETNARKVSKLKTEGKMLETLSIMQHHDAITGTHRRQTGRDYSRMMMEATSTAEAEMTEIVS